MFKKVLVANRGEIAVRVIRALRFMNIRSVAVYSDADSEAMHVALADESYRIGPPSPAESYLNQDAIIKVAKNSGAEAIHPGYGFLSENSNFVKMCEENGIVFIGPSSMTLELTGNKSKCRENAAKIGVPVTPGSKGVIESIDEALEVAEDIGYPVMIKSAFGGGGLGIREAENREQLKEEWNRAISEAKNAFGRASLYLEKLVKPARHIEIQIFSDKYGNFVHLGERECSIQRRHQKLIEITPSPIIDDETRNRVGEYALKVARSVKYLNAGTVEFLRGSDGQFYFMEVNSRLQVEHPITEETTGVDIVVEQVNVAGGEPLSFSQPLIKHEGAAIECRITAEDPLNDFTPDSGVVRELRIPGGNGVRVDTALMEGVRIPEFYDSLIAKVITRGKNLDDARKRMIVALQEFNVSGIRTTLPFHLHVLNSEPFSTWKLDTNFIEENDIVGSLKREEQEKRSESAKRVAAIVAYLLSKGIHKQLKFETGEDKRTKITLNKSGGRFIDYI